VHIGGEDGSGVTSPTIPASLQRGSAVSGNVSEQLTLQLAIRWDTSRACNDFHESRQRKPVGAIQAIYDTASSQEETANRIGIPGIDDHRCHWVRAGNNEQVEF
jgi:hypothetical protein